MKHIFITLLLASTALAQTPTPSATAKPSPSHSPSVTPAATATATATATPTAMATATASPQASIKPEAVKPDSAKKAEDLTAEQQGGSPADREMTKNIRRSIVKTESLSGMAKNIKVITISGKVTLRGPVHSEQEKTMVGSLAEKAAGKGKVTNLLEVRK